MRREVYSAKRRLQGAARTDRSVLSRRDVFWCIELFSNQDSSQGRIDAGSRTFGSAVARDSSGVSRSDRAAACGAVALLSPPDRVALGCGRPRAGNADARVRSAVVGVATDGRTRLSISGGGEYL